jgi:Tfp pilus assembly protein FimT
MKKNCSGFTLIELLLIFSITALLFSVGIAQYSRFNRRQILNRAKEELISNLRLAQSKALAAEKPLEGACANEDEVVSGHQLRFSGDDRSYIIVAVCGDDPDQYPEVKEAVFLPEQVFKTSPEDVVFFKVLSQGVDIQDGTNEMQIILSGFNETRTITVTKSGEIK